MKDFDVEEVLEGGDTNKVFLNGSGNVVKKFSRFSAPSATVSLAYLVAGHPRFFTCENRMTSEERIREQEIEGLNFPKIVSSGEDFMVYEYIEGRSLKQKALNLEEAEDVGRELGELLNSLHSQEVFLTDLFLENFIDTGEGLYHVDPEFAGFEDCPENRLMDLLSVLLTLKLLPPENYRKALKGFEQVCGEVSLLQFSLANSVTILYSVCLGSREEFVNSVRNLKQ